MKENRIIKFNNLAATKFLNLYSVQYKNKIGNIKDWIIASRKDEDTLQEQYFNGKKDNIDGVVIVALHKATKKLVIIKQYRVPINNYVYELVAGLVDPNEDIKTTVTRELMEETGLKILEITNKGNDKVYASPGMTDEALALVYCTCEGEFSKEYLEEDEDIEAMLVSQEEAKKIIDSDEKIDVKCFLALQSFVELGEKLFV
ncbi:NUDIX hydrolase [Clostridium uliginosum]|uniref:ADP-ribose pyrophosphatase n=1 Tax=Clostridium uliginosum TaxID=119641 RepID=A0A1I1ST65_9CLOT|nr:NUDIX hydrolase [Clostridium uliginosum]SFD47938.1 ADP-ribose pyrophosphatase [Clostridium uliginosum]